MDPDTEHDELTAEGFKAEDFRSVCLLCRRPEKLCLCGDILPFETGVARFVILMHPRERRRASTGTGRLTHLFLKNSEILTGIDFSEDERVNRLIRDPAHESAVLFPGREPMELGKDHAARLRMSGKRLVIFVIDGTWITARKIMKLSGNLNALPRICLLPGSPSRFAIRRQPHPQCLSTIEAVHGIVRILRENGYVETAGEEDRMLAVLDKLVALQNGFAADPAAPGYRKSRPDSSFGERIPLLPITKNARRIPFPGKP